MKINIFTKLFWCVGLTIFLTSCVVTGSLNPAPVRVFNTDDNNVVFLETRTASAPNLTLSEIFVQEKTTWGKDISIVNVVEQTQTTTFFKIFSKTEKYYIYDVVRNNTSK